MPQVRQNLDGNAIFKDPYSAQPDIVSGVVLVWLESSGHLEVGFADFLLFGQPCGVKAHKVFTFCFPKKGQTCLKMQAIKP